MMLQDDTAGAAPDTAPVSPRSDNPLDQAPMRTQQILVLCLAGLLSAIDGYDAMAMAFAAPALAIEWGIDKNVMGLLLSSSLVGMAFGAILLSPLADKLGRRPVVLSALLIMAIGTFLSAIATNVPFLATVRFLTGSGLGVMVAMTTLLSAEFSNVRRRALAVAAVATIGFPLGGAIGGFIASAILRATSWHWVFLAGSIAGTVLLLIAALLLPESPIFVIARRRTDALHHTNRILARLGQPAIAALPLAGGGRQTRYRALFEPALRPLVVRLTIAAVLIATASYYILNWLPQMIVDAGYTPADGSLVSAQSGMIGLVGGIFFAAFAARFRTTTVAAVAMAGGALALVAVGLVPPILGFFVAAAGALGFCLAGTTGLMYTILATTFPPGLRASGMGFVMGVMRVSSAAGPVIAGILFTQGLTRAEVSIAFAVGPLIAALLIATLPRKA